MSEKPQFAYTGPMPATGYVGYVNIQEVEGGVRFLVRSEGAEPVTASYVVPKADAAALLGKALAGLGDPLEHDFWRAGEANCPSEIKAWEGGEVHTLRCKRCGQDNPSGDICVPA